MKLRKVGTMYLFIKASSLEPEAHNLMQFEQGNVLNILLLTLVNDLPISASSEVFFSLGFLFLNTSNTETKARYFTLLHRPYLSI